MNGKRAFRPLRRRAGSRPGGRRTRELELAVARLAAAERRYRSLYVHSGEAILETSPDGRILAANPAACELFGYSEAELRRIGRDGLVVPGDPQPASLAAERALAGVVRGELTFRRGNGETFIGELISSTYVGDDGQERSVTLIHDVTAHRRLEEALRASARRYRALLEATPDPMVIVDKAGVIVMANSQAERAFGYTPGELVGLGVEQLVPERLRGQHQASREGFQQQPWARPMGQADELWLCRKDGSELPVEISLAPMASAEGRLVLATIRDVTARKQAMAIAARREAELRKARELNALKDHFLSTISHEIKTPLTLIEGYAELLQDKYPNEQLLAGMLDGGRRLTTHINRILTYCALAGGSIVAEPQEVHLFAALHDAVALVEPQRTAKAIVVKSAVPHDLPLVLADPRWLAELLHELLDNAVKFSPPGSTVELEVRQVGDRARLEVRNGGAAIGQDDARRIWDAFAQTDLRDSQRTGGLGLGLAISRLLARLLGGTVGLVCLERPCFYLELPLARAPR